jgi:hypothetical protein
MKATFKGLFTSALAAVLLMGCSQQNNPVESSQVLTTPAPLAKGKLITASQRIKAMDGGKVRLNGSYVHDGDSVKYDMSIFFGKDALPQDATISITIDTETFAENAKVTFAPHGLVFKKPGVLLLYANGVEIAEEDSQLGLLYLTSNKWTNMPQSWGAYLNNNGGSVFAGASIPHFSQYAFGRVNTD